MPKKRIVFIIQITLVILFLFLWEFLTKQKILSPFIFSSPSRIISTLKELFISGDLIKHLLTTLYEIFLSFTLGISLGFGCAIILYEFPTLAEIIDPFLTMFNSLPKVALGPLIIILIGANQTSIIIMALLINLILSILNIYNGFLGTNESKLKLMKSLKATKLQNLTLLIIPGSLRTILSSLKINISMTLIGVIMGEFLVSKEGIGYLIIYGTQIFNLNLVITGIVLLVILSMILYKIVSYIEQKTLKKF